MNSFVVESSDIQHNDILLAFYDFQKTVKFEFMKDGKVIYWHEKGNCDIWQVGFIYSNYQDFNDNNWQYSGKIDYETKLPCGDGREYNKENDKIENVRYWLCGDKFVGEWDYDLMNGEGKMTYANGNTYDGQWNDGDHNGFGMFVCADYEYIGQFKNGLRHGLGSCTCKHDGATYDGEWQNDEWFGQGKYTCDIYTYVGSFACNDSNGYGVATWNDGAIYTGFWTKGLMNGEGSYTCKNYTYVGEFIDDLSDGFGKISWKNGNSYEGMFIDDNIDLYYSKGIFTFADGNKYIGKLNKIWDVLVNSDDHKV
jgi:hypothetical protein